MPGQPLARFAFRARENLVETLQIGNLAADLREALRDAKHRSPNDRTLARVCYHSQLMKQSLALSILQGLKKFANLNQLNVDDQMFLPTKALVEFNCEIVGLAGELARVIGGPLNVDSSHLKDIADIVGTTPQTILQAACGKCILIPEELANAIAAATSRVIRPAQPVPVRARPANETEFKPLGGERLEKGWAPFRCNETIEVRAEVLRWLRAQPTAAA
ncbi:hypothetical protein [Bradyrhizobium icense]|uniref:Uncharacterized protein n=1 Tax=Bradyrhizobium icense TaxID=1274631 RepID=A0A1B1UJX2_9BRAD|nr:hypothetical protein [Bradyrhizobium icense]ANW02973.1 hypothetical protein LMTR13_25265 [Bradyrhizobium icense]